MATWLKWTIAGLLLVGVILLLRYCQTKHPSAGTTTDAINQINSIYKDSTEYWKDQYDQEHADKEEAIGTLQEVQDSYDSILLNKSAASLGVNASQIQNATSFNVVRRINTDSLITKHDTVFLLGTKGKPDTVVITQVNNQYLYLRDSLQVVQYLKKKGWFTKTPYIDILSITPNSKVTAIQGFAISSAPPKWVPTISTALIYNGSGQWFPAVGGGFETHVFKIPISFTLMTTIH